MRLAGYLSLFRNEIDKLKNRSSNGGFCLLYDTKSTLNACFVLV